MDRKRPPRCPEREYFAHSGGKNDRQHRCRRAAEFSCSDKNDPLFCGFAMAYFFATWGNTDYWRLQRRKSTEKWVVFITPNHITGRHRVRKHLNANYTPQQGAKTRGAQGTSGSQMLEMLTKGGVICQQKGCSKAWMWHGRAY